MFVCVVSGCLAVRQNSIRGEQLHAEIWGKTTAELRYVEVVGTQKKYFDIGMVRDNQLGIMGSETLFVLTKFALTKFSCNKKAYEYVISAQWIGIVFIEHIVFKKTLSFD